MTDATEENKPKKTLTLGKKLDMAKVAEKDKVRQSFSHGRSKSVTVEVRKKRNVPAHDEHKEIADTKPLSPRARDEAASHNLTEGEMDARLRALKEAQIQAQKDEDARKKRLEAEERFRQEQQKHAEEQRLYQQKLEGAKTTLEKDEEVTTPVEEVVTVIENKTSTVPQEVVEESRPSSKKTTRFSAYDTPEPEDSSGSPKKKTMPKIDLPKKVVVVAPKQPRPARKLDRASITRALNDETLERTRSIAALRRARQKDKHKSIDQDQEQLKVVREVIITDTIGVQELANRMAVRGADVVKALMKLGMMVTINQTIDGDTAELLCEEFGHKFKRVSESDVEISLALDEGNDIDLKPRAPVVTVMGHVDHGKTSLLDAIRNTQVVSGEAGGITQHIGAYQVTTADHHKITFIDTPGHEAFSQMRARGANITDIVILVVAADDSVKTQTIEAIHHAKAAGVPMIVAINKIDKPDANPMQVRSELLQHEVVLEDFGGDVLAVEVSAKKQIGLDKLIETIILQTEMLDLKANPERSATGVVIEAKMERGRGAVATVLVQKGTLHPGDIFIAGSQWGRVRALVNEKGETVQSALPSTPVEVFGFSGTPEAGDEFMVVENEGRAREVAEFRQRRAREALSAASAKTSMERLMSRIAEGKIKDANIVIKSDVQGSLEAISTSLQKLNTDEVAVRIIHGGVGGINESDVSLAKASDGIIIGFNVRANPQARELARIEKIDIRYYSIIYDVIDDIKKVMSGMLAPEVRENFLGYAEIREVFNVTKFGKIAGCYVTEGLVKRGAKVRLLRDNVVIHEGTLKSLRRFKDEVKEVKESYECGMAFENYEDLKAGDTIECFELESIARHL